MKAFSFRLEHALRWRAAQVDVEKAKLAAAANALAAIRADISRLEDELVVHARLLSSNSSHRGTLAAWSSWNDRTLGAIRKLRTTEPPAKMALSAQLAKLAEANRQWQLIENLKEARKEKWTNDFRSELENFAAESFLGRLQSKRKGA